MKRQLISDLLEALQVMIVVLWMGSFILSLIVWAYSLPMFIGAAAVFVITSAIIVINRDDFRLLED